MRLLDPLTGIRLAYGNWILHAGYMITIAMLPQEEACGWKYSSCKNVLLSSHILEVILTFLGFIFKRFGYDFFRQFTEGIAVFLYHGAVFWV